MKWVSAISVFTGFLVWHLLSAYKIIDPVYFPSPISILEKALVLISEQAEFRHHVFHSLRRLLLGQALAFPLALLLALITTIRSTARAAVAPWIALTYPIPKLALFPFLLIVLGTGDSSKVAMIGLGSFFLMYLSFTVGFRRIFESELFEVVRVYRVSRLRILWYVLFRGALPEIINGIKMGFGYGMVMMVGSEMTMSKNGLGFFMWNAWDQFRLLEMYACLSWISFFGIIFFGAFEWLENRAAKRVINT